MANRRGCEGSTGLIPESIVVAGRAVQRPPIGRLFEALEPPRVVWSTDDVTAFGGGAVATVEADGADRFTTVRSEGSALFERVSTVGDVSHEARPRLFGGFSFHDVGGGDPSQGDDSDSPWAGFPGAKFVLPSVQMTITPEHTSATATATGVQAGDVAIDRLDRWCDRLARLSSGSSPDSSSGYSSDPPGLSQRRSVPDQTTWRDQVASALAQIREGPLRKVVLAQAQRIRLSDEPVVSDILRGLSVTYPNCIRFSIQPAAAGTFFGASPERLVSVEGLDVRTGVLAGSTGRGVTPEADESLADELATNEKDVEEHELVLEAVCDQLTPLTASLDTGAREVRTLETVQHLQTPVSARLDGDRHVLELVDALHPTPAVGGMPPDRALGTIERTETFDRGWYAGPVGWFDAAGDGDFAVAIRSAVTDETRATLFAGAGIVADSDPDSEWDELQLKYRPILDELE